MHDWKGRFNRFLRKLEKGQLDGFVVSHPANLNYLFNFDGSAGTALVFEGDATLLVDSRYVESAESKAVNCSPLLSSESSPECLHAALQSLPRRGARIGFESARVSHDWASRLQSSDDSFSWIATVDCVEELRVIKEPSEIAALKKAFATAQEAFAAASPRIEPGMSEAEAAAQLELEMRRRGGQGAAFETIVASGPRSSLPHGLASQRRIEAGEPVLIDFGIRLDCYNSDLTRVLMTSKARAPEIMSVVREAQLAAISAIRPGALTSEVDEAARQVIRQAGYGGQFGHGTGHGLGLEVHELPRISPRFPRQLEPGMAFTVEPGIYIPGRFGIRIEDAFTVTATGCEPLSDPNR